MSKRRYKPLPGLGQCYVCSKADSRIRYFFVVPLPRMMYLCQDEYNRVKEESQKFVRKFLGCQE